MLSEINVKIIIKNFFQNHQIFKLRKYKDITDIFTGFCKEKKYQVELKYFCKTHNILCCPECIAKIKKMIVDSITIVMYI